MPRGKRAESNGAAAHKAKKQTEEMPTETVETPSAPEQHADDALPANGHNSQAPKELTDDERYALLCWHKKGILDAREAERTAKEARKRAENLCKSELGKDAIKEIDDLLKMRTPAGEAKLVAEAERILRVARWSGLPVGSQVSLFDEINRTPAVERARANGKREGLAGERCAPPHDPVTEQYRAYMEGYGEGQAILFKIKPIDEPNPDDNMPVPFEGADAGEGARLQ